MNGLSKGYKWVQHQVRKSILNFYFVYLTISLSDRNQWTVVVSKNSINGIEKESGGTKLIIVYPIIK